MQNEKMQKLRNWDLEKQKIENSKNPKTKKLRIRKIEKSRN